MELALCLSFQDLSLTPTFQESLQELPKMAGEGQRPGHRRGDVTKAVVKGVADNTVAIANTVVNTVYGAVGK